MARFKTKDIKPVDYVLACGLIAAIFWLLMSAAIAQTEPVDAGTLPAAQNPVLKMHPAPLVKKVFGSEADASVIAVYDGTYEALSFPNRIKLTLAPMYNPAAYENVAVAHAYPAVDLVKIYGAETVYELIATGFVAPATFKGSKFNPIRPTDDEWVRILGAQPVDTFKNMAALAHAKFGHELVLISNQGKVGGLKSARIVSWDAVDRYPAGLIGPKRIKSPIEPDIKSE